MRFTVLMLLLFSLALVPAAAARAPALSIHDVDRIVAIVNDDVITATELEVRVADIKRQLATDKIRTPEDAVLRKQVLERLVLEQIQLQIAAQAGVRVTDADVDRAIQTIAERNSLNIDGLDQAIRSEGLDPATYRDQLRKQITVQQLLEREINNRVTISENEVDNFIRNAGTTGEAEREFNLGHIFIGLPESATTEQIQAARQLAEQVHRELKAGEDFARAAVTHSHGPDALKGGALGWKKAGQLPELFLTTLMQMRPGEISDVLRGPNGFHIVQLIDRRDPRGAAIITQTHVRHILLRAGETRSAAEVATTVAQLRRQIEAGQDFAALARTHSDDAASAANGGDLGWVAPGQLVPEFERAMNDLAPLALSAPVTTPFGVHLIQVLERRRQEADAERLRAQARGQLHARKSAERFEQWMRQLRDEAYVEYLLEE